MLITDEPEPLTEVGLKAALAPAGKLEALNETLSENPPEAETLTL